MIWSEPGGPRYPQDSQTEIYALRVINVGMCLGQYSNKCCTMGIDPLIGKTGSHRTAVHIYNVYYPTDIQLEWVKCSAQPFTPHMLTYSIL